MKKQSNILKTASIFLMMFILVTTLAVLGTVSVSAAYATLDGGFDVHISDLVYTHSGDNITKNWGTDGSTFTTIEYSVVNSTTIRFTYQTWVTELGSNELRTNVKTDTMTATLNDYSCDKNINETIAQTYKAGSYKTWTYNLVVEKSAGHVYDNACDTDCNICGETRTTPHSYVSGACDVCGTPCPHTSIGQNGLCECGIQFVAAVTVGDETTYYQDIETAFAAVEAATSKATFKLVADVEISDSLGGGRIDDLALGFDFDLAGKTLYNPNGTVVNYVYNNGTMTVYDSVGGGQMMSGIYSVINVYSPVVINGGIFKASLNVENAQGAAIWAFKSSTTITGGSFYGNGNCAAIATSSGGEIIVNGGTFYNGNYTIDYRSGTLTINGGSFPGGLSVCNRGGGNNEYRLYPGTISEFLADRHYIRDGEDNLISSATNNVTVSVTVKKGANLETDGATVTVNGTVPYTGLACEPTDAEVTLDSRPLTVGTDYTLSWSNNVDKGTATVTATGTGDFSGTASGSFEIVKGVLKVLTNPESNREFGDAASYNAITGGTVVPDGNESTVIPGTWTWVDGTDTAIFTPDAQYSDLFDPLAAQAVTFKTIAATPVLTLESPSSTMMPGMTVIMTVTAKNPHDEILTDGLPTSYKITYKVGESGTPVEADGLSFTLPVDVSIGATVYVTVKNVAVADKYLVGTSNTVELFVGQVDYSQIIDELEQKLTDLENQYGVDVTDLKNEISALKSADQVTLDKINTITDSINTLTTESATKTELDAAKQGLQDQIDALDNTCATDADVQTKIDAIQDQIDALDSTYATDADITNIQNQIDDLKNTLATKAELETAKQGLQDQIDALDNTYATDADVQTKIDAIQDQIDALDDTYATDADITNIQNQIDDLKATLATKDELDEAKAALQDQIDALDSIYATDAELGRAIAIVQDQLNSLDTVFATDGDVAGIRKQLDELKQSLDAIEAAAKEADAAVLQQAQAELDAAKAALEKAIAEGDTALDEKITALDAALDAAKAALEKADADTKAELMAKIDEADSTLDAAIKQVQKNLDEAKAALEAKDEELSTMATVAIVIGSVGVCGNLALLAWITISKRRIV